MISFSRKEGNRFSEYDNSSSSSPFLESFPHFLQLYKDNVSQGLRSEVGDAHCACAAIDSHKLMGL